jgi:GntP family gluconate:H+ symporter
MTAHDWTLILIATASVGLLVLLVTRLKLNAFLGLLLAALALGVGGGLKLSKALAAFQDGLGATLGGIAGVIGLGVMLGKLLAESGGAEVLARRFNEFFGPQRVGLCIMALALAVGLTTWFAVGLFLLLPILLTLTQETRRPFLLLAIPLLSCLSVMHGLMPPHPGPVIAVEALKANTGIVLLWGFVIGLPTAAIAGPVFARWAVRHVVAEPPPTFFQSRHEGLRPPGFGLTLFTITLPVALMLVGTVVELALPKESALRAAGSFIGNPTIALGASVLLALWSLGTHCGHGATQLLKFTEQSVANVGMTLLIVGAGGGFARVLREAGVAASLGNLATLLHLPPLLYGWLVAAFVRVATGSATVAITAASGVLVPLVASTPGLNRELLIVAIGCGSLFLSHLNDSGFWIVKDCFGLTVGQTLRTWTVTETLVGICGLLITLMVDALWRSIHG